MGHRFKQVESLSELQRGDIIRGNASKRTYVVSENYGERVTAVATADITNADEWEVLRDAPDALSPPSVQIGVTSLPGLSAVNDDHQTPQRKYRGRRPRA